MLIVFPSGLTCEFRKLKGKELSMLANAGDNISSATFIDMLRACWVRTVDAGPYTHADEGVPNWNQVVSGDLLFGITMLSAGSIPDGDRYVFTVRCEDRHRGQESSTRNYKWGMSLSRDVKVQRMSEEARAAMRAGGNRFQAKLLTGETATFKLLTVTEDKPLRDLLKLHKISKASLAERFAIQVESVSGVKPDVRNRYNFFLNLDNDALEDLRTQTEKYDCGFKTNTKVKCPDPSCGWDQEVQLPFDLIFSPRLKLKSEEDQEEKLEEDPDSSENQEPSSSSEP